MRIGETPALLLGPLTIEPPFRDRGIGKALMERALDGREGQGPQAGRAGRRRAVLRKRVGFKRIPSGQVKLDGPVDPARMLVAELVEGAFKDVSGVVRPDWDSAEEVDERRGKSGADAGRTAA